MKLLMFFIELPIRFIIALVTFTLTGPIGWLGVILVSLRFLGVIHWSWWLASLPLEYGVLYCIYMTIDGALYRAGLKKVGGFARSTQPGLAEYEEASRLAKIGEDAYSAEKMAELAPKIDAMLAEFEARQKNKEKQNK